LKNNRDRKAALAKILVYIFIFAGCLFTQERGDLSVLKGSYLGQKPPGVIPKVFAPGIVSTEANEGCSGFLNDATLYVFKRTYSDTNRRDIFMTEMKNGGWTQPIPAPFDSRFSDGDFTVAPDGKTLYFTSRRSLRGEDKESDSSNIWITEIRGGDWSEPYALEYPVNTEHHDSYPSVTQEGTIYFFSRRPGGLGKSDIYRSRLINGKYKEAENLGPVINTTEDEWDPFIAADESFLIFCSTKPGGYGRDDLYVTFRRQDDSWTEPVNFGDDFNSSGLDNRPYITPDGKYFFFVCAVNGNRDIYWVDAKIIMELKQK
jgi:Tol biopolymer transport system component